MKLALATCLSALALAGTALADTSLTATLAGPAANGKVIAAGAVWNCAGATCVAQVAPDDSYGIGGCQELAHKIGRVTAFTDEAKSLDARGLERCNKEAATPKTIGTASR